MGTGRDKRKKAKERKDGPLPGKGQAKTQARTEKKLEKKEKRADRQLEGDEDDIDALLAKMALEEKARKGALEVVEGCDPPGPRVNASFNAHVTPRGSDIYLFGGECSDLATGKVMVYKDLYRFSTDKRKWWHIVAPNGPPARSAHQGVVYKNTLMIFGGEFTSPNQERFLHYKDLWRLDLTTLEWDCLPSKGGPSARSGHRMMLHKSRLLLFGGFYDTGREVKYYNDLWELNLEDMKWTSLGNPSGAGAAAWPSPRSGCGLAVAGDTLWVFGGYSKAHDEEDKELEHGKAMDDVWACNLATYTWERVKKQGMAPGARASFALAPHLHPRAPRAFLFGGVSDHETKGGEDLSSEFHNDLYTFNFERRRWFAAELKPPAGAKGAKAEDDGAAAATVTPPGAAADGGGQGQDGGAAAASTSGACAPSSQVVGPEMASLLAQGQNKDSAIYRAAVKIQARYRGYVVRKAYQLYRIGGVVSEILYSPAAFGLDLSVLNMPKPRARIGALMTIVGATLWLLGGTVEVGDKEVTLDDMWCLDVIKLDGWQLVRENTVGEEVFKQVEKKKGAAGSDEDSEWTDASGDEDDD